MLSLGGLWFDVNTNSIRDDGENFMDAAGPVLLGWQWAGRKPATPPVIRFYVADAAWLDAYAHLLQAICEMAPAYDPTEPRPVDLAGWIQGWAAMPYCQTGETVSRDGWSRFESMMEEDAMLFVLWFN